MTNVVCLVVTFSTAIEFCSQGNVPLPCNWVYANALWNVGDLKVVANDRETISVPIKNLEIEYRCRNSFTDSINFKAQRNMTKRIFPFDI